MCTAPQPSAIPQPPAQPEAIRAALAQVAPQLLADFDLPSLIVDTRDLHPGRPPGPWSQRCCTSQRPPSGRRHGHVSGLARHPSGHAQR